MRDAVVRGAATLLLALAGLLALGLTPALAAVPAPTPVPEAPYGGALDGPQPGSTYNDEQLLEVGMLALGSVNGLAFVGVVVVRRFRGHSAEDTRRALINRTAPGVVPGERRRARAAARTRRAAADPQPATSVSQDPQQGGPGVPGPRAPLAPPLHPASPRR